MRTAPRARKSNPVAPVQRRHWALRLGGVAAGVLAVAMLGGACGGSDSTVQDTAPATTATTEASAVTATTAALTSSTAAPPTTASTAAPTTTTTKPAPTTTTTALTRTTTAAPTTTRPSAAMVTVRQFQFMPNDLVVKAGATVTWSNQDQILHTATSGATPGTADGMFDGPMDGVGQRFTFPFEQPGTYPYFCSRHTSMTGTIVVQQPASPNHPRNQQGKRTP